MNSKAYIVVLLLLVFGQGARAWDGSGTSADPYLIKTSADWRQLAADVKGGNSFSGKYFRLTADINVSTGGQGVSVGTADCRSAARSTVSATR